MKAFLHFEWIWTDETRVGHKLDRFLLSLGGTSRLDVVYRYHTKVNIQQEKTYSRRIVSRLAQWGRKLPSSANSPLCKVNWTSLGWTPGSLDFARYIYPCDMAISTCRCFQAASPWHDNYMHRNACDKPSHSVKTTYFPNSGWHHRSDRGINSLLKPWVEEWRSFSTDPGLFRLSASSLVSAVLSAFFSTAIAKFSTTNRIFSYTTRCVQQIGNYAG